MVDDTKRRLPCVEREGDTTSRCGGTSGGPRSSRKNKEEGSLRTPIGVLHGTGVGGGCLWYVCTTWDKRPSVAAAEMHDCGSRVGKKETFATYVVMAMKTIVVLYVGHLDSVYPLALRESDKRKFLPPCLFRM